MQGTINSYSSNGEHHTKLEYNITPLKMQNKCQVYLKVSVICDENFPDGLSINTSNTLFCTINSIDVNYNNFTDNTIYSSIRDIPSDISYPYSTRFYFNDRIRCTFRFTTIGQTLVIYEGTTEVNYNSDGTLTIQINNVDSLLNGTPTLEISVPAENASNGYIKTNNTWKHCWVWFKVNNVWKRCFIWKKINGTWKKGI